MLHKLVVPCPKCHSATTLVDIYFETDGKCLISTVCVRCNVQVNEKNDVFHIIGDCIASEKSGVFLCAGNASVN